MREGAEAAAELAAEPVESLAVAPPVVVEPAESLVVAQLAVELVQSLEVGPPVVVESVVWVVLEPVV
jgi:hypothetical protein